MSCSTVPQPALSLYPSHDVLLKSKLPQADGSNTFLCTWGCHCQTKAFICLQFITCCLLSMGHAAETVGIAANCFAITLQIHRSGEVQSDAEITWHLRLLGAAGMVVGMLLGGWRLVPVSGMFLQSSYPYCSIKHSACTCFITSVTQHKNSLWDEYQSSILPWPALHCICIYYICEGLFHSCMHCCTDASALLALA